MRLKALILQCIIAFFCCAVVRAQTYDFGDMHGGIPTTLAEGGPHHLDVSHEWIGAAGSVTTTENDAKAVDEDDGVVTLANVSVDGTFANMGRFAVTVTTDTSDAVRYVNAAADINGDGVFMTYPVGAS